MMQTLSDARREALQEQRTKMVASRSLIARIDWGSMILILLALAFGLWRLDVAPPLFWDEGWHMMVARTWVDEGHYGRLLGGLPNVSGLDAGFPLVVSVALAFHLLGVGVWQGRLVVVLYTVGALLLVHHLARRLFNRRTAAATLAVVLLMTPFVPQFHVLHVGRMVLGETPMLFFLLAGYACLRLALEKSPWFLPLALVCWVIALDIKLQVLPFWAVSLGTALLVALWRGQKRTAGMVVIGLVGSLATKQMWSWLWALWLGSETVGGAPLGSLIGVTALVFVARVRLIALRFAVVMGGVVVLGLVRELWKGIRERNEGPSGTDVVRWALLALAGSWLGWYVLFSVSWIRYLMPVVFLGSMFAAALLHDWTDGFDISSTMKRAARLLGRRQFDGQGLRALLAIVIITWTVTGATSSFVLSGFPEADTSVQQAADFLNSQSDRDALVEGYLYELFFLLDRPYHYPPDEVNVPVIEALTWQQQVPIEYDPLSADPDYLVVNWDFITWIVYDKVLQSGAFRSLRAFGPYEIYERVR